MIKKQLSISGMSCGHCVRAVREALERLDGVDVLDVQIGRAEIEYDPNRLDAAVINEAVEEEGYPVEAD
jgi:copper chaperone